MRWQSTEKHGKGVQFAVKVRGLAAQERYFSKCLYNKQMPQSIAKEESMPNENQLIGHSQKESELLSVEPFDLEGFNSNGQFLFKRNYLRKDAYNDSEIELYLSYSTSSQLQLPWLEPASAPIHSEISPPEFKLQGLSNTAEQDSTIQNVDSEQDKSLLAYHMGHMAYFAKRKNPIFPQSRKFMKTKKKSQRNQSYYAIACKYMTNKCRDSCKRFDQKLQQQFQKLPPKEQEDKDETYEAIRHLLRAKDPTCQSILKSHREKYLKKRHLALFLQKFVNSFAGEQ